MTRALALLLLFSPPALAAKRKRPPEGPAELTVQLGHSLPVTAVALSADGRVAATGGRDGWAILWDVRRGRRLRGVLGDRLGLTAVALSPDAKRLLTGGAGTAILWDAATGKALRRFGEPGEFLVAAWLSPDAKEVTTVAQNGAAVWSAATGRRLRAYPAERKVTAAALRADGRALALAQGAEVAVWSTTTGVRAAVLDAGEAVRAVTFVRDGGLATASDEGLRVWDPALKLERASFKASGPRAVLGLPSGRLVSAAGNTARLWDAAAGRPLEALIGHLDAVGALAVSADGRTLATGSDDHTARTWDLSAEGRPGATLGGGALPARWAAVTADGRRLVAVDDRDARLFDLEEGRQIKASTGDWALAGRFSLTDDGRLLACVRDREMVDLRDLEKGQDLGTFQWNLIKAASVSLDPRGRFLVTGYEQRIQVWNLPDGSAGPAVDPTPGRLAAVLVALGGRRIVAVDDTGEIRFWSLEEGRWLARASLGGSSLPRVLLSRDGRFLAGETERQGSRSMRVFDLETGQELKFWQAERGAAPLAFGRDGSSLLVLDDGGAWEWDILSGRKLRALELSAAPPLDWPQAADPRWRFVLGSVGGEVRLVSLDNGRERGRLALTEKGWYVQAPDGRIDGSPELLRWTRGLASLEAEPADVGALTPGLLAELAGRASP